MALERLLLAERLLGIPRPVRCDLRRARAAASLLGQMLFDLLAARTRCLQVLFRIAPDLRRAVLPLLDFVAQFLQSPGEFRLIHCRAVLLAAVQLVDVLKLLLPVFPLKRELTAKVDVSGKQPDVGRLSNRAWDRHYITDVFWICWNLVPREDRTQNTILDFDAFSGTQHLFVDVTENFFSFKKIFDYRHLGASITKRLVFGRVFTGKPCITDHDIYRDASSHRSLVSLASPRGDGSLAG